VMCAAMFGLVIGGAESAVHGDSPVVSGAIVLLGAAIGVVYVRRERAIANPILPVDLLVRPVIALSAIGAFTAFVASMTLLLSTPFRLTQEFGLGAAAVGAAIAPWPLTNMIVAPLAGWLSDRVPAGLLGGIGMAISIIALLLLANLPAHPSYFDIAWRMALCGSGFGTFLPPNARLIIGSAPKQRAAAAGGLVGTVRLVGQTTGATLVAALLALGVGGGATPAYVAAGLALVAGLCSLARLRYPSATRTRRKPEPRFRRSSHPGSARRPTGGPAPSSWPGAPAGSAAHRSSRTGRERFSIRPGRHVSRSSQFADAGSSACPSYS
jgi:DHA2 family multidrug resistance protein-like MFS transporter